MNSRERVLATLKMQKPDRVPFVEMTVDNVFIQKYLGNNPPDSLESKYRFTDDPVLNVVTVGDTRKESEEICDRLGIDAVGISFWIKHEGIVKQKGGHGLVVGGAIHSVEDAKKIRLPDPDDERLYKPVRDFIKEYRDMGKALYSIMNLCSDPVILGMGFENFSVAIYTQPDLVHELFELYGNWSAKVARNLSELDLDFLWSSDDIAFKTSTYVSPEEIRKWFMPHYKKVTDNISKPWIYHSDGMLYDVLDDLLSLGMSGLHPVEPGSMDLRVLKEKYGHRITLIGHIDVDKLSTGTPEEIDALVKQAIEDAAYGGGYICGSANSIPNYADPANVEAMSKAILKYGKYQ